jgi:hypothetical protein
MKKIIVITRRASQVEDEYSLGFINDITISKYTPKKLDKGFRLFEFWSNKLCVGLDSLDNTDDLQNKFDKLSKEYLPINVDYCLNIYQLKDADIFVYHQWLDKQGLGKPFAESLNLHFLSALRQDILRIIKEDENDELAEEYEFNWLIHDSDLLGDDNYDGLLWFEGKNYTVLSLEDKIPNELKKDNIWSFIHDTKTSKYYKDYIIEFFKNTHLHTTEDFYNNIAFDSKSCLYRFNFLNIKTDDRAKEMKQFIFQNETWASFNKLKRNNEEFDINTKDGIKSFLEYPKQSENGE